MTEYGPMRREYSRAEVAAGSRVGASRWDKSLTPDFTTVTELSGPLVWATGPWWPDHARKLANDWTLVADAMEREWTKEIQDD